MIHAVYPDLLPHLATNQKVRLTVESADEPVCGYLIGLSDDLALLHTFADFDPDGYTIVRTDDAEEVRRSEHEAFWDTMLAAANALTGSSARRRSTWARCVRRSPPSRRSTRT